MPERGKRKIWQSTHKDFLTINRVNKVIFIQIVYTQLMDIDIAISDEKNQLSVQFEIKNKTGTTREWAGKMFRNLLAHGNIPVSKFFLLVLPDRLYLWKNYHPNPNFIQPDYEIDSKKLFEPYYNKENVTPENISEGRLESILSTWLSDVRSNNIDIVSLKKDQKWLFDCGLFEEIQKGKFHYYVTLEAEIHIRPEIDIG